MWGGIPLQDILRVLQRGPCTRSVASSACRRVVTEPVEGPSLLLHTVPFDWLRERIFLLQKKNTSPTKNRHTSRHPELDSGSVKHSATVATDPESSSGWRILCISKENTYY